MLFIRNARRAHFIEGPGDKDSAAEALYSIVDPSIKGPAILLGSVVVGSRHLVSLAFGHCHVRLMLVASRKECNARWFR